MSFFSRVQQRTLPLIAAASSTTLLAATLLTTSPVFANDAPEVTVDGAGRGQVQLNNPLRFEGTAKDSDGIKNIFGTIQNAQTGKFISQRGKTTNKAENIKFNFKKSTATRWASPVSYTHLTLPTILLV